MTKLVFCLHRLPHLSREEFQRYWYERHGPLVRGHAAALGIRRYVQTHTLEHPVNDVLRDSRGGTDAFDGVAELRWESVEELAAATATDAGRAASLALLEDERKFIDLERSTLFVAVERPVVA
jgi:uncharacterized protein (TIGR02118 family)